MREVSRGRSSGYDREGPNVRESIETVSVEGEWRQMTFEELLRSRSRFAEIFAEQL